MNRLPTQVTITDASGADVHTGRWLAANRTGITVAAPAPIHFRDYRYADGFTFRFVTTGPTS